nr:MAG TPA: hypothetical protein [Caudoviricetes sp.]
MLRPEGTCSAAWAVLRYDTLQPRLPCPARLSTGYFTVLNKSSFIPHSLRSIRHKFTKELNQYFYVLSYRSLRSRYSFT